MEYGDWEDGTEDESVTYVICHCRVHYMHAKWREVHLLQQAHAKECSCDTFLLSLTPQYCEN